MSEKSFWDFFIPQVQAGVEGAKTTLNEGDTPENQNWAHCLLDATADQLKEARLQTKRQIADRNNGTYNPEKCEENGQERSKHDPRHRDYKPEEEITPAERRARHRRNMED